MTVPEPMEEGAAVEAIARAIQRNNTGHDVGWPARRLAAKAALDAISYPTLLAELTRQAAVVDAAREAVLYDALYEEDCGGNCDGCKLAAALAALDTP